MPLEDLIPLGYEVFRPDADAPMPRASMVVGNGQSWGVVHGEDEERLVATVKNHKTLNDKMTQALTFFGDNYRNWATLTAVQKDAANRQAQRALANLIRLQRNDLSSGGE